MKTLLIALLLVGYVFTQSLTIDDIIVDQNGKGKGKGKEKNTMEET